MGAKRTSLTKALTIAVTQYSAGDVVGGLITFSNAGSDKYGGGKVSHVILIDDDQEKAEFNLMLFDAAPTTIADHAAFALSVADAGKVIGSVNLKTYVDYGAVCSVCQQTATGLDFKCMGGGRELYGYLVAVATPTFTAATDLTLKLQIEDRE